MRRELCSQSIEPFFVIGDVMDCGYDNASVDNLVYTFCYFGGTTLIFCFSAWAIGPCHFVLFLHIWDLRFSDPKGGIFIRRIFLLNSTVRHRDAEALWLIGLTLDYNLLISTRDHDRKYMRSSSM